MNLSKIRLATFEKGPLLYFICTLTSIVLFALSLYVDDVINNDGMDYIYAAYEYINGDANRALNYRKETLFYSQIGILSKYSGLSLIQAAYLLSLFAQIALMCGFLAVIRALGASAVIQILAIMIVASMVHFNELRPHIIKGFGFWAAEIWALWAIINFARTGRWHYLLGWLALSCIALLFRIEAIVYLVGLAILLPFIIKGVARNRFLLFCVATLGVTLVIGLVNHQYFDNTGRHQFTSSIKFEKELSRARQIADTLSEQKELIRDTMPNKWARNATSHFLIGGLLFEVAKILLYTTNGFLLILALTYGKAKLPLKKDSHKLIAGYFAIGLFISFYIVASRFFMTDRYVFLPALLLCIPIPFLLKRILFDNTGRGWAYRYVLRGALFIIPVIIIIAPVIRDTDDKMYIRQAAQWLSQNLSPAENIYYNDQIVAFYGTDYSNQSFQIQSVSLNKLYLKGYRYAVIHNKNTEAFKISDLLAQKDRIALVHSDTGPRGAKIDVYKILEPGA